MRDRFYMILKLHKPTVCECQTNQIKCLHHVAQHVMTTWFVIYDPLNQ